MNRFIGDRILPFDTLEGRQYPKVRTVWERLFRTSCRLLSEEVNVYADFNSGDKSLGRIDYIAMQGQVKYLVEEDMAYSNKWHWTKTLAYKAAYLLDNPGIAERLVKCLIFLPSEAYSPGLRNLCAFLGVEFACFDQSTPNPTVTQTSVPNLFAKNAFKEPQK